LFIRYFNFDESIIFFWLLQQMYALSIEHALVPSYSSVYHWNNSSSYLTYVYHNGRQLHAFFVDGISSFPFIRVVYSIVALKKLAQIPYQFYNYQGGYAEKYLNSENKFIIWLTIWTISNWPKSLNNSKTILVRSFGLLS